MAGKSTVWKKGRGKLGALAPLLGTWNRFIEHHYTPAPIKRSP